MVYDGDPASFSGLLVRDLVLTKVRTSLLYTIHLHDDFERDVREENRQEKYLGGNKKR